MLHTIRKLLRAIPALYSARKTLSESEETHDTRFRVIVNPSMMRWPWLMPTIVLVSWVPFILSPDVPTVSKVAISIVLVWGGLNAYVAHQAQQNVQVMGRLLQRMAVDPFARVHRGSSDLHEKAVQNPFVLDALLSGGGAIVESDEDDAENGEWTTICMFDPRQK